MQSFEQYDCNIYVGTIRGVLANTQIKSTTNAVYNFGEEKSEITALEWGHADDEIIVGYKSGVVKLYNNLYNKFTKTFTNLKGKGSVVGLGKTRKSVIIGLHSGDINVCKKKAVDGFSLNLKDESTLECMVHSRFKKSIIGVGGEKNDFKLWDCTTKQCVFKAKSLGHDELNLPIPTSIRGITFLGSESHLAGCATKEGHVLLYDERAQRRPILKFLEPKASYSVITSTHKERQCVVGTTKGYIQLLDLRSPTKCVNTYKSFTGGVTGLMCDPAAPYVVSSSLDRHLRIHNLDSKELLFKKYMKQSLTKLLIKRIIKEESIVKDEDQKVEEKIEEDQEYENMFENMEVIGGKKKKHKLFEPPNVKSVKKKKSDLVIN